MTTEPLPSRGDVHEEQRGVYTWRHVWDGKVWVLHSFWLTEYGDGYSALPVTLATTGLVVKGRVR